MVAEKKVFGIPFKVETRKIQQFIWSTLSFLFFLISCQETEKNSLNVDHDLEDQTSDFLPGITFLDSLSPSLKPQKTWLKETSPPITIYVPLHEFELVTNQGKENQNRRISLPQKIERPYLKNERGEAIFDAQGNHYFLGESGISHFTSFNTDNGLSLDNITSSLIDRSGNIWFGTWGGGISKFDGISFVNFSTEHGLSNNLVNCLAEDLEGNIWVGTNGGGISVYDGYSFSNNLDSQWLKNGNVYGIAPDSKGNVWIAAGEGGAYRYDGEALFQYSREDGLPSNNIIKILEDSNGFIWFGTGNDGVSRFDGKSFIHFTKEDGLAGNGIYCISTDKAGNIWFGTNGGGISRYEQGPDLTKKGSFKNFTISEGIGNNEVWDIVEDLKGNMWFATGGGGVSKFDGEKFTNYTTTQGLAENVVYSISADGNGNLWFGTAGGGVSLYMGAAFNNFNDKLGLAANSVYSIIEDNGGNLWFGTDGGGVSKYDGKSFTNFSVDQGLPNPLIISAEKDKNGKLWFGTGGGGIVLYQEKSGNASFTTFNTKNGLPNDIIYAIKEDRKGNIWIGTGGGGLAKFDWNIMPAGEAGFTGYTKEQGLADNYVYSILEDSKGNLWIGTGGGGISKFDGQSFTNFTTAQGLSNNIVWSMLEDKAGNLWFATQGGGVSRYDGQAFSTFSKKEGLVDDTVYDLLEDKTGNIFIGTNRGFTVVPSQVATLPFQEIRSSLEYYNTSNGYPVKDVNKGIFLDSQGNIWSGNGSDKTGLVKFNYQALRKKNKKPTVKIKNVSLNEKQISWISLQNSHTANEGTDPSKSLAFITDEVRVFDRELSLEERKSQKEEFSKVQFSNIRKFDNFPEKLILPYSQNQITINFGTDELVRPGSIEYKYILEGYKKGWSPVIQNTSATFGNIREGDYVFKVIARYTGPAEGAGKEWSEEAIYEFSVLPPVHRTWWAYLIYTTLLIMGIKSVHVSQKSKTIRKEREKIQAKELEQAREIEKAYMELQKSQAQLIQQEKLASLGQLTAGIAHEIKNPLNFVNNFSEVSIELIDEALQEAEKNKDTRDDNLIRDNMEDIKLNLQKVFEHGTRANGIVSSMLQHSRGGVGILESTDLNAFIKEFVKLSFHGMRARGNPIEVDIHFDLDPNLKMIPLIKEDFSRVVINLCNNAFDACRERIGIEMRAKLINEENESEKPESVPYVPKLKVTTLMDKDSILISFEDNGPGIPEEVIDKIMQPFFTTKKGTEGTGLGLSITHDIVKAHGGSITIRSDANGSIFTLALPIKP
jgi:signal transduction histidine kinase/ligand-binding sensor domain-containing protein